MAKYSNSSRIDKSLGLRTAYKMLVEKRIHYTINSSKLNLLRRKGINCTKTN
jgi:hypothetical protein